MNQNSQALPENSDTPTKSHQSWRAPLKNSSQWGTEGVYGLFTNVPEEVYHASLGVSGTDCKLIARGPAYFGAAKAEKDVEDNKQSPALSFGSLAHAVLIEDLKDSQLFERFAIKPEDHNGRTNEGKKWVADNSHKTIISRGNIETVRKMSSVARSHPAAKDLLKVPGISELSAIAVHPTYGITLRGRFDKVFDSGHTLLDYKTTNDASPDGFSKTVFDYGYLLQAAHYLFLCKLVGLEDITDFAWIAQEKEAPYAVAVYHFGPKHRKWDEVQNILDMIYSRAARILKSGDYSCTGLPDALQEVSLPHWAKSVAAGVNLEDEDGGRIWHKRQN